MSYSDIIKVKNLGRKRINNVLYKKLGKNLFNKTIRILGKYISAADGGLYTSSLSDSSDYIPVVGNTNYVFSGFIDLTGRDCAFYNSSKVYISGATNIVNKSVKTPINAAYIRFTLPKSDVDTIQLELGTVATAYEPYPGVLNIVANGLVLYLDGKDFKNSPPTNPWLDKSGLNNNAVPGGLAYTTASGSDGAGGVVLDGVNDNLAVANNLGLTKDFTLVFKLKPSAAQVSYANLLVYKNSGSNGFMVEQNASNLNQLYLAVYNGVTNQGTAARTTLDSSKVQRFVIRRQGSTIKHFLDNVNTGTTTIDDVNLTQFAGNMYIGKKYDNTVFWAGVLKTLLIYNRALTDAELLQNDNALK